MFQKYGECLHFLGCWDCLWRAQTVNVNLQISSISFSLGCHIHLPLSFCGRRQDNTTAWRRNARNSRLVITITSSLQQGVSELQDCEYLSTFGKRLLAVLWWTVLASPWDKLRCESPYTWSAGLYILETAARLFPSHSSMLLNIYLRLPFPWFINFIFRTHSLWKKRFFPSIFPRICDYY